MIRMLVADDHQVVRNGVREMLATCEDIVITGEAMTIDAVMTLMGRDPYDVLLLDLAFPDGHGIDVIKTIRGRGDQTRIVVFTFDGDAGTAAIAAGADAYVTKDADAPELEAAIRSAMRGQVFIGTRARERMEILHDPPDPLGKLSQRENEVLNLLMRGRRVKEIAFDLDISEKTIATHRARLMKKLGLQGNHELILYGIREGLVSYHGDERR